MIDWDRLTDIEGVSDLMRVGVLTPEEALEACDWFYNMSAPTRERVLERIRDMNRGDSPNLLVFPPSEEVENE